MAPQCIGGRSCPEAELSGVQKVQQLVMEVDGLLRGLPLWWPRFIPTTIKSALARFTELYNNSQQACSPLHYSSLSGSPEATQRLLVMGAEVDSRDANGWTPLHVAALAGHAECLHLLLERGAALYPEGGHALTPLHLAVASGSPECVAQLLEKGAIVDGVRSSHPTPLHWAAALGRVEAVCQLVAGGACLDARDVYHWTPLHAAAAVGTFGTMGEVLGGGAGNARGQREQSPLKSAAGQGHATCVQRLLQGGAAVDARDIGHRTPLHFAAGRCHAACVQLLLEGGAAVDAGDARQDTPLHVAARTVCTKKLLYRGQALGGVNEWECTAAHMIAQNGCCACTKLLLGRGADLMAQNGSGQTPVSMACTFHNYPVFHLLLSSARAQGCLQQCLLGGDHEGNLVDVLIQSRDLYLLIVVYLACGEDESLFASLGLLHRAAMLGRLDCCVLLPWLDPSQMERKDAQGRTPAEVAVQELGKKKARGVVAALQCPASTTELLRIFGGYVLLGRDLQLEPDSDSEPDPGFESEFEPDLYPRPYPSHEPDLEPEVLLPLVVRVITTRLPLSNSEWGAVPSWPGLGAALPAALAHSHHQARQLVRRMQPGEVECLRCFACCLGVVQRRLQVSMPSGVVEHILAGFEA